MMSRTVRFADEVIKLKEDLLRECGGDMLENMDPNGFVMVRGLLKLVDLSSEMIREQAAMMESMDKKLDILVYRKNAEEDS